MEALAEQFNAQSQTEVNVNLGPSSGLASQILAGAPADLFLSASSQWSDEIVKAGKSDQTTRLLTNHLVIVVPQGNPGNVREPADLLSPKVKKIALAGERAPAGMYADQSLTKLGLLQQLTDAGKIVRGQDVRTALAYVASGEAEAGIVYSTDVGVTSKIESVYQFDSTLHDEIVYVLVLIKHSDHNSEARRFYEFLQSSEADKVYEKLGFSRAK
jgi:molybdate transport system substrate-binding protein